MTLANNVQMTPARIGVLVVDDHPIVRRGLCFEINFAPEMYVAGEADNGEDAISLALKLKPEVILMDLVLPHVDGLQGIRAIMHSFPEARILVLSSFFDDEKVYSALEAGAAGYIMKDRHPEEVISAIRKIACGEPYLNPTIMKGLMREMRQKHQRVDPPICQLTKREIEVLRWVALGTPNKEIARKISISQATVRAHVSNILSKLELDNRSQLVLYAIQKKLIQDPC